MTSDDAARKELEDLLPWYAAGTLKPEEQRRVEAAVQRDPALARSLALAQEELAETVGLNESLGGPSPRAMTRLLERIEAEAPRRVRTSAMERLAAWIGERLAPRTLAWATVAAAALIAVQTGLLAHLALGEREAPFETASGPTSATGGSFLLVGFAEQVTAAEITSFLQAQRASIVDGPRAGGLYRLRLEATASPDELQRIAAAMRGQSRIVRFAAPAS